MSLHKLTKDDLSLILSWRNHPEIRKSMHSNHAISEQEHKTWFSNIEHSPHARWYVYKNNSIPSGVVYFTEYQPNIKMSSWGVYTAPNSPPGTGTKLGLDALDKAFTQLGLEIVNAEVLSTNVRSLYFHKKLGFVIKSSSSIEKNNSLISLTHLVLSKSDWAITKEKISSAIK